MGRKRKLAEKLASGIFAFGRNNRMPTIEPARMAYMHKDGDGERESGGLCEAALAKLIHEILKT
jgi:hypothetical protein